MKHQLRATGLTKRYGSKIVLDDFSIEVEPGHILGLLGPSGCGKTTALRIMAGLAEPEQGRVEVAGRDVSLVPPERRNVGIVFQDFALFPHLTVLENVAFGLREQGVARREAERRAKEMLQAVALPDSALRRPDALSGGQRQRVALARSLAAGPSVLLLDEPFGSLDTRLRAELRIELDRVLREAHMTAVVVTHDRDDVFAAADQVAVMDGGRIVQTGSPEDLYRRPATVAVAHALGACNVVPADLVSAFGLSVAKPVGFRPEAATLEVASDGSAEVTAVRYGGPIRVVEVKAANVHFDVHISAMHPVPTVGERVRPVLNEYFEIPS